MPSDYANELSSKVGLDVTEWKKGITELNAGTKKIETSFQASAALMDDWSSSSEGLKMRIESLNDELALQKKKLEILKNAYDDVVEKEGATSKAAQELAKKMYQTKNEIDRTESSISTYSKKLENMAFISEKTAKKLDDFASKTRGLSIASTAALGALSAGLIKAGQSADELNTLAKQTGLTTAEIQKFKYASDLIDVSFSDVTGALRKMTKNMVSTSSEVKAAWDTLGVSTVDYNGKAKDITKIFYELLEALSKVKNETERDQLAMQIFGKSANDLAGIVDDGGAALKKLGEEAEESGLILSQDAVDGANNFNDVIDKLKATVTAEIFKVFAEDADNLTETVQGAANAIVSAIKIISQLPSGVTKSAIAITALSAALSPFLSAGSKAITMITKLKSAYKKKTAATVEDTAANVTNAKSLDTTAKSADGAAKNVGGIGTAAKKATPYILAVGAALLALSTWANHYIKKYEKGLDEKYDELLKKSNESHDVNIKNLTDEYNTYDEKMTAKIFKEEKYYNDRIANLENDLKAQKSAIETEKKLYEEAHKKRLSQLEKERDAKLAAISAGEEAQTAELQSEIDALNALTEAEEKAKQEQENAQKLEDLKQAISFAKTYAEKVDAENNYTAEVKRQEEEKTENAREEQIKQLQNKIEQIKSESSARQDQVKSEYDEAVQLENDKYEIAQEGFENRLSALDGFIETETERLEALRDKSVSIMQSETDSYLAELQKRIDKQKELKEAAEESIEAQKEAENSSLNWLEKVYAGGQELRDWFSDVQDKTSIGSFFKKLNDPQFQQNLINKLTGHNASGTDDWRGGLTFINEKGGEIVNLPRHTQIIPHDVSMEMAREYGRQRAMYTTNNNDSSNNYTYNYGAQQQVTVLSVDGKNVTEVIEPRVSVKMSNDIYGRRRSGGAR